MKLTTGLAALLLGLALAAPALAADTSVPDEHQVLVLLQMAPEHFRPDSNYAGSYGDNAARAARRRIAAQLALEHGLRLVTDWPMAVLGVDCYVMAVPPDRAPEHVAQVLSQDARVAWAQPMNIYRAQQQAAAAAPTHNDPLYPAQPAAAAWHLAALHELATGREVRIAVIDSGIEQNHPDLDGQVALARNFVPARPDAPEQHGTAVAGIIAARADNGIGIAGVAPRARLLALRACWQESRSSTLCSSLSLAMALDFAISHDAQVINLSLGGAPDRLLGKLLDAALVRGITVVAAADRSLPRGGFPAGHPGVVAVSDEAPNPPAGALLAPGRDVPTTTLGAHWDLVSGSSYSAAHVSGLFALVRELHHSPLPAASATLSVLPSGDIDTCATLLRFVSPRACACANMRATPPPIAQQ